MGRAVALCLAPGPLAPSPGTERHVRVRPVCAVCRYSRGVIPM